MSGRPFKVRRDYLRQHIVIVNVIKFGWHLDVSLIVILNKMLTNFIVIYSSIDKCLHSIIMPDLAVIVFIMHFCYIRSVDLYFLTDHFQILAFIPVFWCYSVFLYSYFKNLAHSVFRSPLCSDLKLTLVDSDPHWLCQLHKALPPDAGCLGCIPCDCKGHHCI